MKLLKQNFLWLIAIVLLGLTYIGGCTRENDVLVSNGPDIVRGTDKTSLSDTRWTFDKSHSNVMWETAYIGATSLLTGRFNTFGFNKFEFDEADPSKTSFEGYVWLNTVNTGEPGRDGNCLLTTYGTALGKTNEPENLATIKSKSVAFSPTDKGYIVKADLIFHGFTKEVTAKLNYVGKTTTTSNGVVTTVVGFSLEFPILAKTDFGITSNNIGDNVNIRCNTVFRYK
ncbi:MAG TPA: YceI family protein [Chitinophagaceae bacterium]